ncbi:MAG: hypothetical protein ACOZNI_22180 [Myxococcota bacterium]
MIRTAHRFLAFLLVLLALLPCPEHEAAAGGGDGGPMVHAQANADEPAEDERAPCALACSCAGCPFQGMSPSAAASVPPPNIGEPSADASTERAMHARDPRHRVFHPPRRA